MQSEKRLKKGSSSTKSLRGREKNVQNSASIDFQEINQFNDVPRFNSTAQGKRSAPPKTSLISNHRGSKATAATSNVRMSLDMSNSVTQLGKSQSTTGLKTMSAKSRPKSAIMARRPKRADTHQQSLDTADLGPGSYTCGKTFGKGVIGYSFGKPKPDKITVDNRDYNSLNTATKSRSPSAKIDKYIPARPKSFAKGGDIDVAPGQYDDGMRFNSGVKSFKIGQKREQLIPDAAGPGTYDLTRAEKLTKQKMPNINMGSSPARPESFAQGGDVNVAPGQYDDGKRFNSGVKGFKIGQKREEPIKDAAGPGTYDPTRAERLTRSKMPNIDMGSSPARPQSFAQGGDVNVAPGQYDDGKRFNSGVKGFKIGLPREQPIKDSAGPGTYDLTRAERLTKQKMPNIDMGSSPARPQSFAMGDDVNVAPGQYDDGKRFNSGVKGFKIGLPREEPIKDSAGPGTYDHTRAERLTKQKMPNVNMGSSAARPHSFAKGGDVNVAPGQYDDGKRFNSGVKGFKIGEKREQPIKDSAGPGTYDPTQAEKLTKAKMPNIDMGASPARPHSFAKGGDIDVAPGQYDDGKRFNSGVKGFKIGEKRDSPIRETAGPGTYNPDIAERLTKNKVANIDMGSSAARPQSFAQGGDVNVAPGQYDDGKRFNSGVKGFKIGLPREQPIKDAAGPGTYDPTLAEKLTKAKMPNINMGSSPARPQSFAIGGDVNVAPGQYDDGKRFNSGVKGFKIGEKRDSPIRDSAGPGTYDLTRSERLTKQKIPNIDMGQSQARPQSFAQGGDVNVAPGQYDDGKRFNSGVKGFKIGEKRDSPIRDSAGPGTYDLTRSERLTKQKIPNIDMGSSAARPQSFAQGGDVNVAPGQYDDGKRFNSGVKSFKIGEKRESPIRETAGPGTYDLTRSERLTKQKMPNINMGSSPARPHSFAKGGDIDVAPGQYDDGKRFNSGVKGFKIGEKRDSPIRDSAGPGTYDPTLAERLTKQKIPNIDMGQSQARPQSFAQGGDVNVAPGQYDDGKRFNTGVKGFKIGEKRESPIRETAGPGTYNPDIADRLTKQKMPNIDMGSSPSRPQSFAKGGDVNVAPGQYDDGKRFNSGVKGFKIGEKRDSPIRDSAGPGTYDPTLAERLTKQKIPNIDMGSSPSRPQSFAQGGDVNVAPGQYDDGKRFNTGVKGFKIGEKRDSPIRETAGPGTYNPDAADRLTKQKMPNIDMGSSPARPQSFAQGGDVNVAPGQYDDGKRFNTGVKGFKIGEKRDSPIRETAGPGTYNPDAADRLTKQKMPNIDMGSSPSRPQSFAQGGDVNVAPGQYDDGKRFNSGVKGFKIGEKRDSPIRETAGPGTYNPDAADRLTKQKMPNIDMGSSPARPQSFALGGDVNVAPGQYDDGKRFNSGVKGFKIGEKRDSPIRETAGPGTYNPDAAERLTKQKMPNIDMGSSPARPQSFAQGGDVNVAPGQYDDGKRFNTGVKGFKIGEKRDSLIRDSAGPGTYDPTLAEKITKHKMPNIDMGSSPARPQSFAIGGDVNVAPGQYNDGKRFNTGVKGFKIGEKRDSPIRETAGPGTYNPDAAERLTKQKMPNINMGSSPARPQSFAQGGDVNVAPGQYNDGKRFNTGVKGFKIGEKRDSLIRVSAGPGEYSPEIADRATRHHSPNVNLGTSPARPSSFAKGGDIDVAPGQYDHSVKFGHKVNGFTIGLKRDKQIEKTAGPGEYDVEQADKVTKPRSANMSQGNSPSRPGSIGQTAVSGCNSSSSATNKHSFQPIRHRATASQQFAAIREETQQDSTGPSLGAEPYPRKRKATVPKKMPGLKPRVLNVEPVRQSRMSHQFSSTIPSKKASITQTPMMTSVKGKIAQSLTATKSTASQRPKSAIKTYLKPTASMMARTSATATKQSRI